MDRGTSRQSETEIGQVGRQTDTNTITHFVDSLFIWDVSVHGVLVLLLSNICQIAHETGERMH